MNTRPILLLAICCLGGEMAIAQSNSVQSPVLQAVAKKDVRTLTGPVQEAAQSPAKKAEETGDLEMARKNFLEAIDSYQEAVRLRPNNSIAWNKMGIAHHQLMQLGEAKKCYEKAVKLNRKYAEAINNLGTIYYTAKNYSKAIRYYKQALALAPDTASVYSNMGTALFSRKQYPEAIVAYQKALELDPGVFDHHNSYGVLLQERTVQDRGMFNFILAHTYAANHNQERALEFLKKAMEEGFHEPKKIYDDPAFAELVKTEPFLELMKNPPVAIAR